MKDTQPTPRFCTIDFARNLGLGWNLGNSLDSDGPDETSWGNPRISRDFLNGLEAGFSTIRIPVSWSKHVNGTAIDEDWMNHVAEIVEWSLDAGLNVILNTHHDRGRCQPDWAHCEEGKTFLRDVWTQIATRFAKCGAQLVFESMNEPIVDDAWGVDHGNSRCAEATQCIVEYNQVFVDVVRSMGGRNADRYLLVPAYAANPYGPLHRDFHIPNDPASRILISVHDYPRVDGDLSQLDMLHRDIICKWGIGVVLGEVGQTNNGNSRERSQWAHSYSQKAADLGIPAILWDNGSNSGPNPTEHFKLLDRNSGNVEDMDLVGPFLESYRSADAWMKQKRDSFQFKVEDLYLSSYASGKIVSCTDWGKGPLVADRDQADAWEMIVPVPQSDGTVAFRSKFSNFFVSVRENGELVACAPCVKEWEKFRAYHYAPEDDSSFILQSCKNGQYVRTYLNGNPPRLVADCAKPDTWEQFCQHRV